MPFRTRPALTSRQAIIRLASVSQGTEVLQNVHADIARLLGVKLHAKQISAFSYGCKGQFVGASRDCAGTKRGAIGVGEVQVCARGNSFQQSRPSRDREPVPAYVRRLYCVGEAHATSGKYT